MREFDKFIEYLDSLKLYRQTRVKRWQLRDFVFEENDAEHQLLVAQIIVIINNMFNIPADIAIKSLSYGVCHDYVESTEESLGDVNYMIKEQNPELKAIVKKQERIAMQRVPEFYATMEACDTDKTADLIVSLADSIEALLYVNREIKFNAVKDEWLQIQGELMVRITDYWKKLNDLFG